MAPLVLDNIEEMARAIEDMEIVLKRLKSELELIKRLAGWENAGDCSRRTVRKRHLRPTVPEASGIN